MAKKQGVWGIDIGQCALKALYCTMEDGQIVAEAFDYIEYPKILSQPEANPEELIEAAVAQFIEQNDVKGSTIAMSVPGQAGLARFFKPPPVDAKKIPEIVRYEAKQQIPFDLDEVIWDFQKMSGGQEVDGFTLDAEVGLFAMKRDQVYRAMEPLTDVGLELNIIQLAPLCVYNFAAHDLLRDGPSEDEYDSDDPPESLVILSMGTESSDLVVTNGFRVWQRSIPIGGNHFTKQLTKELKLTFAKAEHLKRNARKAEDPRRVFQAMRPVFNDLVTEVQRSIGFFQNMDRQAKLRGVVLLGNTVKLPGLQHYLSKNLGYDIVDFKKFRNLDGSSVISAPAFKENVFGFSVCYGLCLQGLKQSKLSTNLVPREIVINRIIREKKPWAVAGIALLMLACSVAFIAPSNNAYEVKEDREFDGLTWIDAKRSVSSAESLSRDHQTQDGERVETLKKLAALGEEVVGSADRRLLWLEFLRALDESLPTTDGITPGVYVDHKQIPITERKELFIDYVESEYFDDLATWYTADVKKKYLRTLSGEIEELGDVDEGVDPAGVDPAGADPAGADPVGADPVGADPAGADPASADPASADPAGADPAGVDPAGADPAGAGAPAGNGAVNPGASPAGGGVPNVDAEAASEAPEGPGWVIELKGHHLYFSSKDRRSAGMAHLHNTLLRFIQEDKIELPVEAGADKKETFTLKELGIGFAIVLTDNNIDRKHKIADPNFETRSTGNTGGLGGGLPGGPAGGGLDGPPGGGGFDPDAPGDDGAGDDGTGDADGLGGGGLGDGGPSDGGFGGGGFARTDDQKGYISAPKYDFVVQFVWQEKLLSQRLDERRKMRLEDERLEKERAAAAELAESNGEGR